MNRFESFTKPLTWFMALMLTAFVAGCGGDSGGTAVLSSTKAITAFSIAGATGVTTGTASPYAIAVAVPNGTAVTALVATFTTTGANVKVGTAVQTSGVTANNFTTPVAYTVTAANGTTATYNVTVTAASASAKAISTYSLAGVAGTITGTASPYAIAVTLPNGTSTTQIATFTTTGASVKVSGVTQISGTTSNSFASPVAYIVTAADSSTATYNVTVTVSAATSVLPGIAGTTGANLTNPTVISANPSNADINVATSTRGDLHTNLVGVKLITATFSGAMDPATINSATPGALSTFTLKQTIAGTNVSGTVAMNTANTMATFTPAANLAPGVSYTATVTTAAKNTGSITAMPKSVAWSFTTRAASAANQANPFVGQAPIDLLSASSFAILSSSPTTGITETGTFASVITGNVGLSPGPGSAIGIHCSQVGTNTIYGVDATYVGAGTGTTACYKGTGADITLVNTAVGDMGTASGEAGGRTLPDATNVVGATADIGGLTFYPGLYKYTAATGISTNVTLDAQGDTNAVWIFQISGDLTVPPSGSLPGIQVLLTNGAKAANVFWQVTASSFGATIGTYNTFNGNILSSAQVILRTGAVFNGRALAATAVVLDANPVTFPAP